MSASNEFWRIHWREHLTILILLTLIGVTLLFCHRCFCEPCHTEHSVRVEGLRPPVPGPHRPVEGDPIGGGAVEGGGGSIEDEVIIERVEGEGGECGALCVSLAWATVDDLDLMIFQPNGALIFFKKKVDNSTGGVLDVDANRGGSDLTATPVENITWNRPLAGRYEIRINRFQKNSSAAGVPFSLLIQNNSDKNQSLGGVLTDADTIHTVVFDFPFSQ